MLQTTYVASDMNRRVGTRVMHIQDRTTAAHVHLLELPGTSLIADTCLAERPRRLYQQLCRTTGLLNQ